MKKLALVTAAGLLAYGAYRMSQRNDIAIVENGGADWLGSTDGILTSAGQNTAEFIDTITGGIMKLSNMAGVTAADVAHPQVRALLRVIRAGEGTSGENGYRIMFGGATFESFADHPRQKITKPLGGKKITSTAAGAYQFLSSTWDETARIMGLGDFSPGNQDRAAVGRIAARGALEDTKAGRFDVAIQKIAREWASMPGSPYGQPVISLSRARSLFADAGGTINQA
jgi:muramidase (phage lysozyme)